MELTELLKELVIRQGSDLFLSVSAPPCIKVEGKITPISSQKIDTATAEGLLYKYLTTEQKNQFEKDSELNIALRIDGCGRFRLNAFRQMGEIAVVIRHINNKIPSFEQLGLPDLFKDIILLQRGLVLLVGGTGTGKSTTLAAMIDYRNEHTHSHILTIEDPVEYVHEHKNSLVNQREVGVDTVSFSVALKNAMRESPDIILIGEIRDKETMKSAMNYAETGHLCLATLHANNASQAFDRILGFFATEDHKHLQQDLSRNLKAIISQRLPLGISGKRVAAFEIMIDTPYVKDLISRGKFDELTEVLNKEDAGSQSFENALFTLVEMKKITQEEALNYSDSKNNLNLRFRLEGTKQEQKIHKKVVFDELANFSDYDSYCLKKVRASVEMEDRVDAFENAMRAALMTKGLLEEAESPDIEVQYVFVTKEKEADSLGVVEHAVSADINVHVKSNKQTLLRINILDTYTKKVVWQVTASREMAEQLREQAELDRDADFLFDQFPPFVTV